RGAAADFVENDEAALAGLSEDRRGLDHFDHEGRAAASEVVGRADAAEQAIDQADGGARGRDEAARLGEQHDQRVLAQESGLAAQVGSADEPQPIIGSEEAVVGDEAFAAAGQRRFDYRMTTGFDLQAGAFDDLRAAPAAFGRALRLAGGDVDTSERR